MDDHGAFERGFYRSEAIAASRERIGSPINNQTLPMSILTGFLITLFVSALIFVAVTPYAKKETVAGHVVPAHGVVRIATLRAGTIKDVLVWSGDRVQTDQPVFSVTYDQVLEDGTSLSNKLEATAVRQATYSAQEAQSRTRQIEQSKAQLSARIAGLKVDLDSFQLQRGMQSERVVLLEKNFTAASTLIEKEYISAFQLRQREDALLAARQSLAALDQNIHQTQSQVTELQAQLRANRSSLDQTHAAAKLNEAEYEEKRLDTIAARGTQVLSRKNGRITNIQVRAGDTVTANQTLGFIVPEEVGTTQQVNLWVPSRAIGFVQVGTPVRLMFDAFPYQTFGVGRGRVVDISSAPMMPNDLPIPIDTKEQMYRIVVALESDTLHAYGRDWRLIPGMRLTADLVLDRKSIMEWLMDPLTASRDRAGT